MRTQSTHLFVTPPTEAWKYLPEGPRRMTVSGRDVLAWVNIQNGADAKEGMIFARPLKGGDDLQITCPGRPGFILPVPATCLSAATRLDLQLQANASAAW